MGCASSKSEQCEGASSDAGRPGMAQSQRGQNTRPKKTGFACFLSHFKIEAATEARWLQGELEEALGEKVFLDSDDLHDLSRLRDHVRESKCVLLLQTKSVLARLWCLVELVTAIDAGVPIVGISITSGQAPYDFAAAATFMAHLDTLLDAETQAQLAELNVDVVDAAYKLANTLPKIISAPLNMNESRTVLTARIADIVGAMGTAALPALPDRDEWLAGRASAPAQPRRGPSGANTTSLLASLPPEVPTLPESAVARPDLISALKKRVLNPQAGASAAMPTADRLTVPGTSTPSVTTVTAPPKKQQGSGIAGFLAGLQSNATAAAGMGGVGKTMTAAALARDEEVRATFEKICWVSVGQEPDTSALQETLYRQLVKQMLPEAAQSNVLLALEELKEAAKSVSVLLVLDDVWDASHATPLNFVDDSATRSAVVVTTRIRSLLNGVAEVSCGVLSAEASLELLLRAGGCEDLLDTPPPAAVEAVELCGRLPLALGIAGGIIEELGSTWRVELCELLKDEFSGESIEERVVLASLRATPEKMRDGVEALVTLFAIFAEDAIVPDTAIDVVTPMMRLPESAAPINKRQARQCLKQLLKANILRGSMDAGVSVHDLVRDIMIRRAEAARDGGLRAMQREAVPLLLAAFDDGGPAAGYVSAALHWHVRQAQQPDVAIRTDALLMSVLTHEKAEIRKQGTLGIGVDKMRADADAYDRSGEHLEAAQLMWAISSGHGQAAGAELYRAWGSLRRLEAAGHGSLASRTLESRILNPLILAPEGGPAFGSDEHAGLVERMKELGSQLVSRQSRAAACMDEMNAEVGLAIAALLGALDAENANCYYGPPTIEMVVKSHMHLKEAWAHFDKAASVAPDDASRLVMSLYANFGSSGSSRHHALPEFDPVSTFGVGGARLRENIERYNFDKVHHVATQMAMCHDVFAHSMEPLSLLLFFGDLTASRVGFAKVNDAHKRMLARVRQGTASPESYAYETIGAMYVHPGSMILTGDLEALRSFMAHSLVGATIDDEAMRSGVASLFGQTGVYGWRSEEGHCNVDLSTWLLVPRGVAALLEEDTDTNRRALRAWLPPPKDLLRMAKYETGWLYFACLTHPTLLFARLHGERLGDWHAAAEVADGALRIEQLQPMFRTEAHRLLGRAKAALGERAAACKAAERAVEEAAKAKYAWLEMLSLRDLLRWCEEGEAEGVRVKLRNVAGRLKASAEELTEVLGEGVL